MKIYLIQKNQDDFKNLSWFFYYIFLEISSVEKKDKQWNK